MTFCISAENEALNIEKKNISCCMICEKIVNKWTYGIKEIGKCNHYVHSRCLRKYVNTIASEYKTTNVSCICGEQMYHQLFMNVIRPEIFDSCRNKNNVKKIMTIDHESMENQKRRLSPPPKPPTMRDDNKKKQGKLQKGNLSIDPKLQNWKEMYTSKLKKMNENEELKQDKKNDNEDKNDVDVWKPQFLDPDDCIVQINELKKETKFEINVVEMDIMRHKKFGNAYGNNKDKKLIADSDEANYCTIHKSYNCEHRIKTIRSINNLCRYCMMGQWSEKHKMEECWFVPYFVKEGKDKPDKPWKNGSTFIYERR